MSEELEHILRKALDEAESYRKRVVVGSMVLCAFVVAGLGWLDHLRQTADVRNLVFFSVVTLLVAMVTPAVITWGIVAEASRKTLKAIELLAKNER